MLTNCEIWKVEVESERGGGPGQVEDDGGRGRGRPAAEAQCCRHLLQETRPGMFTNVKLGF